MFKPAIVLDADMSAAQVLERLAQHGIWTHPTAAPARAYLEAVAARVKLPVDDVAKTMGRDARKFGAAIRRQFDSRVLWYARELQQTLDACAFAPADLSLREVLSLHESDAAPTIPLHGPGSGETPFIAGILMDQGEPIKVWLDRQDEGSALSLRDTSTDPFVSRSGGTGQRSGGAPPAPAPPTRSGPPTPGAPVEHPWPRLDAPDFVPAGKPFEVVVGFAATQQSGVAGGPVTLTPPAGVDVMEVTVELSAGSGLSAPKGWSRVMKVPVKDVLSAEVRFELIGAEPATPDRPTLTMLEVRYVLGGTVCGTACRPLAILRSNSIEPLEQPATDNDAQMQAGSSPVTLAADEHAPDLTLEIIKTDRNASSGAFVCRLYSPHAITTPRGPFDIDLGQDAKTFAKSLVDEIRLYASSPLLDIMLQGKGQLVAQRLPGPVFDALREVAAKVAPAPPAVLVVSAEPYVPWELAWLEPPLDPSRPNYLGAQALVGRWLRDSGTPPATGAAAALQRPSTHPVANIAVRNMAVLAAWYKAETGLARLVNAEAEAQALVEGWSGLPLSGTAMSMRQLITATLKNGFQNIGGVEAVHFAGHGDFDPTKPDASALFLEDGTPLSSTMFRAAQYGGERQPLLFLNGCMLGIGGDLLGDMAGFPGNSLRGGFGAVIGALWEIDDAVAHDIALAFWKQALPPTPPATGIAVGQILRDMRANYMPDAAATPVPTYLAYVYYGHPRLVLQRATTGTNA